MSPGVLPVQRLKARCSSVGERPRRRLYLFKEAGFLPQVVQEVEDAITAVALVSAGMGMSFVPLSGTNLNLPGVVFKRIHGSEKAQIDLSCFYRADDHSPLLRAVLREIVAFRQE